MQGAAGASIPCLGQQVPLPVPSLAPSAWGKPVKGKDPLRDGQTQGMIDPCWSWRAWLGDCSCNLEQRWAGMGWGLKDAESSWK